MKRINIRRIGLARLVFVTACTWGLVAWNGPSAAGADSAVEKMIAAHGGMDAWRSAPSVSFTDEWSFPGGPMPVVSNVVVEQGTRRAMLEFPDFNAKIGWDGTKAWSVNWAAPSPPRFLALLNYYFLNLPWLVEDPGVVLGDPTTATLFDDPTKYISIRVTYEEGVGDTPEDYYVLFIDPRSYELHGCEYVVTYPTFLKDGETSTPPHILVFDSLETVSGLKVPTAFTVYTKDHTEYASCRVKNWSFSKPFDPAWVVMPVGSVVDSSLAK